MLSKYEAVCYELLRPAQVRAIRERCPIAYITAGALEWHGFQNPLGTDSLKAHAIACEAALKHGGVVLPPFNLGLHYRGGMDSWGPEGWTGYTLGYTEDPVFEAAIHGNAKALVKGGWKVIVGVTGHDVIEQREAMRRAIDAATQGTGAKGLAVRDGDFHTANEAIPYEMDHAAAWETSCMLYAYPDKTDMETLRNRKLSSEELMDLYGPEGIEGMNPLKYASYELGKKIIETMGDLIGARARAMLDERVNTGASALTDS